MNAAELTRSCLSICVTCLSQGRKLFPVNDSKSQASLLLNISEGDKLCWECHFFVLKVFAFRSRAERAQALLASALHQNNVTTLNSLSSIMMTPIYMDINVQSDLSQENLKTENIKQESENTLYECPTGDTCISINVPASGSSQEMGVINASWLPIFNIQKEAKGDEGSYGEVMGDDLANASLKSLLSKRSTLISIPPLANKYEDDITIEMEEVEVLREKEVAKRESGNMFNQCTEDSRNSDNAYCAESSEGMGDVIWIPVLNKQIEAKGDERLSGKAISDDIANASLKSLLSRKSTFGISPLPMNSKKYDPTAEVEVINEVSEQKEAAEVETVEPNAPTDSESIYTETVLSEEEMLKWRERKKDLPYYATKAAALNDDSDMDTTPSEIEEEAKAIVDDLLPEKSKEKYLKVYTNFTTWRSTKNTTSFSENVLLTYFNELSKTLKPSTLWAIYSMLKATIALKHDVSIQNYKKLTTLLKRFSDGYKSKKSKTLTAENVETFLMEAPDHIYLAAKVALIFGVNGACRANELTNIKISNIENHNDMILINLPNTKTKIDRSFVVRDEFLDIVKKYINLRPKDLGIDRFFLNYKNSKCTKQPMGRHKIAAIPKIIAAYLNLPNTDSYTGHCFRRTSATLLADSGANLTTLKRHGGWMSDKVAEGYIEDSKKNKLKINNSINESVNITSLETNTPPRPSTSREDFKSPCPSTSIPSVHNTPSTSIPTETTQNF